MIPAVRVLIVDDDEEDYIITSGLLDDIRSTAFESTWASSYQAGLAQICAREHDVYLLDYRLGARSGLELLSESIACGCTAPIILLTGQDDEEIDLEAVRQGAADYLCKQGLNALLLERSIRYAIERKKIEEKLVYDAMHDALTGLPNRTLFMDRLASTLRRTERAQLPRFAVLFLDLDRFKVVNDGLGHAAGDELLKSVAIRLKSILRPGDTVARLGGDEFTILLEEIDGVEDAIRITERVMEELALPYYLGSYEFRTSASIGIAFGPCEYDFAADILRDADVAMYAAKAGTSKRFQVFDRAMHQRAMDMLRLESEIRVALDREEFTVYFQPIMNLSTGEVNSFEALVRWRHPVKGFIPPAEFIETAEDTGQIIPIGNWVLRQACRQLAQWKNEIPGSEKLSINVNISAKEFAQPGLVSGVMSCVQEFGISPHHLQLEITETAVMNDPEMAFQSLSELHRLGIGLALDDFGVGHSSLSHLQRYPIDILKIDRSFIKRVEESIKDLELVRVIVMLGRTLGIRVVAEGIENLIQARKLRDVRCNFGQGYLYSRPLPQEDATRFLQEQLMSKDKGALLHLLRSNESAHELQPQPV